MPKFSNPFRRNKEKELEKPAEPSPEMQQQESDTVVATTATDNLPQNVPVEATPIQEPIPESPPEAVAQETVSTPAAEPGEVPPALEEQPQVVDSPGKTYLKAMPLRELIDVEKVKSEVTSGNIVILKVTPLASKNIEDVKKAVNDLFTFTEANGGDIARLGEERVVICPKTIRIWREKTPAPVSSEPLPTTAA